MKEILFRFYGELNDLAPSRDKSHDGPVCCRFDVNVVNDAIKPEAELEIDLVVQTSVKDAIEGRGVPHTEVGRIIIDGEESGWDTILKGGERVSVFPHGYGFFGDIESLISVQYPEGPPAFLADETVGQLAKYLRLIGFDTTFAHPKPSPDILVAQSNTELRVLLTTDRKLLMHSKLAWGKLIYSREPTEQAIEVLERFGREHAVPYSRCMECNTKLRKSEVAELEKLAPESILKKFVKTPEVFTYCSTCDKLYWPGSHTEHMNSLLSQFGVALG